MRAEEGRDHKIIIEYDGFMEHFGASAHIVNESNYQEYYSPEDLHRIYFAGRAHAFGILEAIEHYDFFDTCTTPPMDP